MKVFCQLTFIKRQDSFIIDLPVSGFKGSDGRFYFKKQTAEYRKENFEGSNRFALSIAFK